MNYYLLTFDIDTTVDEPTDYHEAYTEMCKLRGSGYTIKKLCTMTTFLLSHERNRFQELKNFAARVFQLCDDWVVCRVQCDQDGKLIISDKGTPFDCTDYED